jgi:hypothetical protein
MKTSFLLRTILGLCLVAAFVAPPAMAGAQDFTLVNRTGVEIHQVFASSSATDSWEEDILGEDTLPDGESVEIQFSPKEDAELWDLRIADGEGNTITWERLNLLEISKVTLHYKDGKAWADTE